MNHMNKQINTQIKSKTMVISFYLMQSVQSGHTVTEEARDGEVRQVPSDFYEPGKVAPPLSGAAQGGQGALPPVPLRGASL